MTKPTITASTFSIYSVPVIKVTKGQMKRDNGEMMTYHTRTMAIGENVLPSHHLQNATFEQAEAALADYIQQVKTEKPEQSFNVFCRARGLLRKTAKWVALEKGQDYITPAAYNAADEEFKKELEAEKAS